jgi:hypothetical protein
MRIRTGAFAVVGIVAMLGLVACTNSSRQPSPSVLVSTPAAGASTASPAASYDASALQLCTSTDIAPLAALQLRVQSKSPVAAPGGAGSSCFFDLLTATGEPASLTVTGSTFESADQATHYYEQRNLNSDGAAHASPLAGLGEQASGDWLQEDLKDGLKQSIYGLTATDANLFVEVEISVAGRPPVSAQSLAGPARAFAEATLRAGRGG